MNQKEILIEFVKKQKDDDLWLLFAESKCELRERNLIRTSNIIGERGEQVAIDFYSNTPKLPKLQAAPESTQNIDAISINGERYSVKTMTHPGKTTGVFYGLKTNGVYQNQAEIDALNTDTNNDGVIDGGDEKFQTGAQPGDIRFVDVDGDGIVEFGSSDDETAIGNPIPDATMGFNLHLNYKDFDFSTSLYASIGNDAVRSYERFLSYSNKPRLYLDRWKVEGTSNTVPRASTNSSSNYLFSDFYVEDGSYLRIQNIQLGYSLPISALKKAKLDKVRLYIAVNNLYTFTKYSGYNPDVSNSDPLAAGVDLGQYPQTRTFTTGVNISF